MSFQGNGAVWPAPVGMAYPPSPNPWADKYCRKESLHPLPETSTAVTCGAAPADSRNRSSKPSANAPELHKGFRTLLTRYLRNTADLPAGVYFTYHRGAHPRL